MSGNCFTRAREERSGASGDAVSQRAVGNRVARESVRSAIVFGEQERGVYGLITADSAATPQT